MMLSSSGWKDILRPIRDGYRHIFPSPDTGPTPEERQRQRASDQLLKGFTYFDTFDQLYDWSPAEADAIQRSNTPLLIRSRSAKIEEGQKANVLLCHDYSGNYHDYEASQGIGVDEESYSCEYLQFVDTFIYFSHKLACVPPPSWTNTLHRNGVKVLGTYLVEPQTNDTERLLEQTTDSENTVTFPMAHKLADIAKHYGFDGWLINIEKPFHEVGWNPLLLDAFLQQLKDVLGVSRQLIWYDALTAANKIEYQNALTPKNLGFSKACGSILTNYCWKESNTRSSLHLSDDKIPPQAIFFGVDVWAQNTTPLAHRRTTYPEQGGGGTNTGIAVTKLADFGLSVGIFAPAWSFEHFPGHGRTIERAMWCGEVLPENIECSCGNLRLQHPPNRGYPITRSARQFPAGSEFFFYTDFTRAFGSHEEVQSDLVYGGKKLHSQLASQAVLPHMYNLNANDDSVESSINKLSLRLEDHPGRTSLIVEVNSIPDDVPNTVYERWIRFVELDMPVYQHLEFKILLRYELRGSNTSASIYLNFSEGVRFVALEPRDGVQVLRGSASYGPDQTRKQNRESLREIGLHLVAPPINGEGRVQVAEILEICIAPYKRSPGSYDINNVQLETRGEGETSHWRLIWNWKVIAEPMLLYGHRGLPFSDVTGPFSHFSILIDDLEAGRAYAIEFVLSGSLMERLRGSRQLQVVGIGFDGGSLSRATCQVVDLLGPTQTALTERNSRDLDCSVAYVRGSFNSTQS
ncbi:glycoside hydrolase family 85 protein [Pleomassaria siparia CBS 279.74]|uniref:Glycoside hydrolase family 85 protein n=1 Tax=Pleomassaria siparia CBS 279.74 TaxID=1314801 RepID=A0A6G1KEX7_9PLEO|nr:glycoside hydrolase family 85 protein [Pleomassaria siparia CBS 279.74]